MNGQLALMAALAAIGGRWLRTGAYDDPPELLPGNSGFQYVSSFAAAMPPRGVLRRPSTVATPRDWLLALRDRGMTDLLLITDLAAGGPLPPHVASAFSNSGSWALLATGSSAPLVWTIGWEVGSRNATDSRIWSLAASSVPGGTVKAPAVGVAEARAQLRKALEEIRSFAETTNGLGAWAPWFVKALALLYDAEPEAPYHRDLLSPDAALDRRQLGAAVVQGWVFGGMGSWNDAFFDADAAAERDYERLGAGLYAALLLALPAATNGS